MMNYYKLLQIDPSAEPEVIAAAYRRLALKYHPDTNGSSAEAKARMQALNEAYAVLSDPVRRAAYDRQLAAQTGSRARARESHAGESHAAPGSSAFDSTSVGVFLAIALVVLAIVLLWVRTIGLVELLIVLGVSLTLVPSVVAWLRRRSRR